MVKKLKTLAKSDDKQLADAVRTSAHQIWQAGLGAFAKAQEEGGKVFAKLVREGTDLQKRTQKLAENKVSGVSGTVTKMADTVSKQATGSWDKLEQVFEDRVSRSLTNLGVPSKKDIQDLTKRVEELSKAVASLSGKKISAIKKDAKPGKKPSAVKTASKAAPKATSKPSTKATAKAKAATKTPAKPSKKVAAKPAAAKKVVAKTNATKKSSSKAAAKAVVNKAESTVAVSRPIDNSEN
jgi:poly(hydroxyalkanoate) granule-associated protein